MAISDRSLFPRLKQTFSTDTVIRSIGGGKIKVMDFENISAFAEMQSNSMIDRFTRMHRAGNTMQYNPSLTYQIMRHQLYADYEGMDTDPILSTTLDILCEEATLKGDKNEVLRISSNDENIQAELYNLFYEVLNIEQTLPMWIRSLCKYGDFFLSLNLVEKFGVYGALPMSAYDVIREEGNDANNPNYIRYVYDQLAVAGGQNPSSRTKKVFENYEMAHFRLLYDANYLPYGRCLTANSYIDTENGVKTIDNILEGDKVWTYNIKNGEYELSKVLKQVCSGEKEIIKIGTAHFFIEGSKEHPVLVYENNEFVYKKIEDLKLKDLIVCSNYNSIDKNNKNCLIDKNLGDDFNKNGWKNNITSIPDVVDEEFARFFGFLLGEKIGNVQKYKITENDNFILEPLKYIEIGKEQLTYDIQVESENSNFIANGIIVHNSYLEPGRKLFKQYCLMLDAMMLHRVMRAPEKRIFFVNVGNIPPNEVNAFMQNHINALKKTPFKDPQTGDYNLKFNIQNMMEDFHIPVRPGDATTRIETAKGLEYDGIQDVEFLRDLMLTAIKVPKAFLNYSDELNGKCIHPDTKIPLLTGEVKTIKEISDIFEENNDPNLWVYSYDKITNSVIPGKIVLAKKTRLGAELVKITLDNGEFLITTPDHGFVLKGGERIDAQLLKEGDSLQAVYIENKKIRNQQNSYQHVYQPNTNKWQPTHKMVDIWMNGDIHKNGFNEQDKFVRDNMLVVHHKDFNRYNNHPDNLQRCTYREHSAIHVKNAEQGIWSEEAKKKAKETKNTPEYKEKAKLIGQQNMAKQCEKNPNAKFRARDAWLSFTFEERSNIVKNSFTEETIKKLQKVGKATYAIHGDNLQKAYKEKFNGERLDLRGENYCKWVTRPTIDEIIDFIENYKGDKDEINGILLLAKKMNYSNHVFKSVFKNNNIDIATFLNEHLGFKEGRKLNISNDKLKELLSGYDNIDNFKKKYNFKNKSIKRLNVNLGEDINNYIGKTYNHKVVLVEHLDYTSDTYNMEVYDKNENHNFLTSSGVIIKNSTISSLDLRFSKTVERIQRAVISELKKIACIHLYILGYDEQYDMTNFNLAMNNPSILYEQEKVALMKEKVDLHKQMKETNDFSSDYIMKQIWDLSDDSVLEERDLVVYDKARLFRLGQIENEGNDPTISGESYGTPHDLAGIYNRNAKGKDGDVPDGYDEKEEIPLGRPKEKASIYGTDKSFLGRDPLGKKDIGTPDNKERDIKVKPMTLEERNLESNIDLSQLSKRFNKKLLIFENKIEKPMFLDENLLLEDL